MHSIVAAGLVGLAAFGVFAGTLPYDLVWDDHSLVSLVERKAEEVGLGSLLRSEFALERGERLGYYRPFVLLSLWLDSRIAPAIPWAFHLTNVLLHTLDSVLVLLLVRRLTGSLTSALGGGLLFAVHPVHTEAVAFVSARTDLWATLFVLVATLLWDRARRPHTVGSTATCLASLMALLLGILSKESALMLPAVLLVLDALSRAGFRHWWRRNRRWLLGWLAVFAVAAALRWGAAGAPFGIGTGGPGNDAIPLVSRPLLIPAAIAQYLRLLVFPWPLNAYYTAASLRVEWPSVAATAMLAAAGFALSLGRDRRRAFLPFAWILLFLLPVLGIVPISSAPIAERFLYLPSVGVALLVGLALERLASRPRVLRLAWGALAAVLASFALATVSRSGVWRTGETLFADLARTSPSYVARGHNNLGVSLQRRGRHEKAVDFFRKALALQPYSPEVHTNLAVSLQELGRIDEAAGHLRHALAVDPDLPEALFALAVVSRKLGQHQAAVDLLRAALAARPRWPAAIMLLGDTHLSMDRPAEAVTVFRRAVGLAPDSGAALYGLGLALIRDNQAEEALAVCARLETIDPQAASRLRSQWE